jgi:hypothetical protein
VISAIFDFKWRLYCRLKFGDLPNDNYEPKLHISLVSTQDKTARMNLYFKQFPKGIQAFQQLLSKVISRYELPSRNVSNFSKDRKKELNSLLYHKDIMISFTDKNLGPCIVDREQNHQEILSHLQFPTYATFSNVNFPYRELKSAIEKAVKTLKSYNDFGWIPRNHFCFVFQHLLDFNPKTGTYVFPALDDIKWAKIYLLWKVHKPVLATRPICPSLGYLLHPLSTWLHVEISTLLELNSNSFIAKDSSEIIRDLESQSFPASSVIASKDVTALYPSISINDGITAVLELLLDKGVHWHRVDLIITLLKIVMKTLFISFDSKFFLQLIGTAMGTPVAVTFANCYLLWLESSLVKKYISSNLLLYYKRYIDDLIGIFASLKDSNDFWIEYNNLAPSIKLTGDAASNSVIYLDLRIWKNGTKYVFKPYQKPMDTYMYLPFNSYHPKPTLKGFIEGELLRFATHATYKTDYLAIRKMFFYRLIIRDYPVYFLRPIFKGVIYSDRHKILYPDVKAIKAQPLVLILEHNPKVKALEINQLFKENWSEDHLKEMFPQKDSSKPLPVPTLTYKSSSNLKKIILGANGRALKP